MSTYHHGDLRRQLLELALQGLNQASGAPEFPQLSLRDLARQAGVSATAVYHHFASKEALLEAVAEQSFHELLSSWEGRALTELGPLYLEFFARRPALLDLMFGPALGTSARLRALQMEAYQVLLRALQAAPPGATGTPATGPENPDTQALFIWAFVHGLAQLIRAGALAADPASCPGGPALWYQPPAALLGALSPLLDRALRPGTT